ncbi:AMP-binding protein [Phenylobacterium sp. J367]|uniref:AMP-binding protein n=1 Tax=Phenylobacterium sp. J367 TaxID=2898435 RepID=UPI00215090BD|nr:AMP-binding protein [Phenylobacterium sp. J367]MCR5879827.1 AMP-binding protein [Phenylobacterium sp. J367]
MADRDSDYGWLARDVVARQAAIRPNRLAVHELASGRKLTFRALEDTLRRADAVLREQVSPGARVSLLARNSLNHLVLFYGCTRAGAIFQPLNWRLTGPELAVLLEDAQPELVIYEAEFAREAEVALKAVPDARTLRIEPGADPFAELLAAATPRAPSPIAPFEPAMLLYTSGTTGRPKGVIVTPKTAFYAAMNFTYVGELTADHAQLCDVPLFHVVGLLAILHATMLAGGTLHLSDRFAPATTLQRLTDPELRVSHFFCVPQMAQALLEDPASSSHDLTGLRLFTGGAPMPPELTLALIERGVRPSNGYGMSENGTILGVPLDPEVARAKVGSAGVAAPAAEILAGRPGWP